MRVLQRRPHGMCYPLEEISLASLGNSSAQHYTLHVEFQRRGHEHAWLVSYDNGTEYWTMMNWDHDDLNEDELDQEL